MKECELKWCIGKEKDMVIFVNENIGDECYNVNICLECAYVLGMRQGQDLPDANIVEKKLKAVTWHHSER